MDDIKVENFYQYKMMTFGLDECKTSIVEKGKWKQSEDYVLLQKTGRNPKVYEPTRVRCDPDARNRQRAYEGAAHIEAPNET